MYEMGDCYHTVLHSIAGFGIIQTLIILWDIIQLFLSLVEYKSFQELFTGFQ
jgi:hypothetical protein